MEIEAPDYTIPEKLKPSQSGVRGIDKISAKFGKDRVYKFTYSFEKTVKIYAGVEIIAFVSILILLIGFVLLVNADVTKFVIAPLENMFEKVTALSKDPMSVT